MDNKTMETLIILCFLGMVLCVIVAISVSAVKSWSVELVTVREATALERRVAALEQRIDAVEKNQGACIWMEQGVR